MTENIREVVNIFPLENIEADVLGLDEGPVFIDSKETIDQTFKGLEKMIKEKASQYDIFILACHLDPNLERLRENTGEIILGIGDASIYFAKALGLRFSIVGSSAKTVELKRSMVERYGASGMLDNIAFPEPQASGDLRDRLLKSSEDSIANYGSDAIILGCAGFAGMDSCIEEKTSRLVIDGPLAALIIANGHGRYLSYKTKKA